MRIQHNIMAMNAYRNYTNNVAAMKKNLEKLSSGYKINRAGDDAAGLAISEKMRAQITGLETAQKNAKDGISLVQTAEGALTEVHDMLNRMVELATQSANGTYDNTTDRYQLQKEMDQLRTEINRIADSANFNGIKLFDGSLSGADITTSGIEISQIDMAKGVEVNAGTVGGGSKGEFTIDLTNAFGDGDKISITFGGTANGAGTAGKVDFAYGTDFEGDTIEKQAQSLAAKISATTGVSGKFNVVAEGSTIKLTSMAEGNKADEVATVTAVSVTDASPVKDSTWKQTAGTGNATNEATSQFALLFNKADGNGVDVPKGSTISFEVALGTEKLTVSLTEGKDFLVGNTVNETATNVAAALNKATFDANDDTLLAEEKISVGDMFNVTANGAGGLEFEHKTSAVAATGITFKSTNAADVASTQKTGAAGTAATKDKYVVALDATATNAQNLTLGDKLTLKGELADGRKFEFDVTAGEDFAIGDDFEGSMTNLKTLLETKGINITLDDGTAVKSSDIFGTGKEITFDAATGTFESAREGTALTSKITDVVLTPGGAASASETLTNGAQQTAAESSINFSEGVEYGAVIEVDGQKYEIVKNEDDVSARKNIAVVVDDISKPADVAKAMGKALEDNLNNKAYTVSTSGSKVTVKTTDIGSTAKAVSMSSSGDKISQLEFTLDPAKIKAGSTVTINDQTYEFVEKGEKASTTGATAIEIANFDKETSQTMGDALAKVANGVKGASVQVDENGLVTVRGLPDAKANITTPTVKFDGGKGGLRLQIGDTAEDFNQMTVSIYNMHTADMGIGDISIADQESAAAAIDKIKSAINYVSDVRGTLGATQNRLDHTINNLSVMTENIQDAESTIRDTDVADEMMAYTKNNILIQSAQAMLAQANQVPQGVLQLLQ